MKKKPEDSPYLNARYNHNSRESAMFFSRLMWQIVGIVSMLTVLGCVAGIIYVAIQAKYIPFVIKVDKLGQPLAVSVADKAAPVDSRVIQATLASFINDARMVTPDVTVQRNAVFRIYAHLNAEDAATVKMNEYMNDEANNPFRRAEKELVSIEITSVLQQSDETWQIDWKETMTDRQGVRISDFRMRALLMVHVVPPTNRTSEEQIRKNPLGMYIRDFNWSKQL